MKIGVFSVLFGKLPFEQMLEKVASFGLDCVEIGTGAYPDSGHCNVLGLSAASAGDMTSPAGGKSPAPSG